MKENLSELLLTVKTFEAKYSNKIGSVNKDLSYYVHAVPNPLAYRGQCDGHKSKLLPGIMAIINAMIKLYEHPNGVFTNEDMFVKENFIKIRKGDLVERSGVNPRQFQPAMDDLVRVGIIDKCTPKTHIKSKDKPCITEYYVRLNWTRLAYIIDNIKALRKEYKPEAFLEKEAKKQADELLKKEKAKINEFSKFPKRAAYEAKKKAGFAGEVVEIPSIQGALETVVSEQLPQDTFEGVLFCSLEAAAPVEDLCPSSTMKPGISSNEALASTISMEDMRCFAGTEKKQPQPAGAAVVDISSSNPESQVPFKIGSEPFKDSLAHDPVIEAIHRQLTEHFAGTSLTTDNMIQVQKLYRIPSINALTPENLHKVIYAIGYTDLLNHLDMETPTKFLDRKTWTFACSKVLKAAFSMEYYDTLMGVPSLDSVTVKAREIVHECTADPVKAQLDFASRMRLIQTYKSAVFLDPIETVYAFLYAGVTRNVSAPEHQILCEKVRAIFTKFPEYYAATEPVVKWAQYLTIEEKEKTRFAAVFEMVKCSVRWIKRQGELIGLGDEGCLTKMFRNAKNDRSALINRITKETGVYDPFQSVWGDDCTPDFA